MTKKIMILKEGEFVKFKWIDPENLDLKKLLAKLRKNVFLKLVLNIQKSYENYTIIILQFQRK